MSKINFPKIISFLLVFAIAATIGWNIRLYPLSHFNSGESSEKATMIVLARLKTQIANQVDKTHPTLPQSQKNIIIKNLFDKVLHDESNRVRNSIKKLTNSLGDEQSTRKYPYLLASDSFHYYALTENIKDDGRSSFLTRGSKYYHPLMLAPKGHWEPITWHPQVGYFVYSVIKLFNKQVDFMYAVSYTPLVIMMLSLLALIWIGVLLNCHPINTLIASIFYLIAPIFLKRSMFAWYDNDPYNTLFPLLILGLVFWSLKNLQNTKKLSAIAAATCLFLLIYAHFWQGWIFIFVIILMSGALMALYNKFVLKNPSDQKGLHTFFGLVLFASFLLTSFAFGFKEFFIFFEEGWKALENFMVPQLSAWPDLFISVGELHKTPLNKFVIQLGGPIFVLTATFGFISSIVLAIKKPQQRNPFTVIILSAYFLISFIIAKGALRFGILSVVPFTLMFLMGLENVIIIANDFLKKKNTPKKKAKVTIGIVYVLLLLTTISPLKNVYANVQKLLNPIYNDTWHEALTIIEKQTPKNSIINAWWPPGHFIKATAKRAVTFDGATINFPQAYWMANVLLSTNEKEALGILRMLNTNANDAADYLQSLGLPLSKTIYLLREIVKLDVFKARILLTASIKNKDAVNHLLSLTHGEPPPSYLMIYNSNVDDNLQFKFIGDWNFKRIEEINNNPELLKSLPDRNSGAYIQFLWQLAGGPHKYSGPLVQLGEKDNTAIFEHNIEINLETFDASIRSKKYGTGIPYSILYLQNDQIVEKKLGDSTLPYSIILYKEINRHSCVLLDRELAQSMLMRLFYFEGKGMNFLEPFVTAKDLTKRTQIHVYRVNWEKFLKK